MTPEQFLTFADPLPEPMLLLAGSGFILAGNRAIEKQLGTALREVRGKHLADVVADSPDEIAHYLRSCSRSRSLVLGSLALHAKGGVGVACRTEGTLLRPRTEESEAILLLRLLPKESAVGQFVALNQRIEDLGREIHRRKLAEATAWQQAERLRVTLHSIGDGVITTDAQGRVEFLNPVAEKLVGWKTCEAAGRRLEDVFHIVNETTRQTVENPALRALRDGKIVGLANHTILISKDGAECPIDDSAAPIRDPQGDIFGSVLVFRDVTEQRRVEHELRASEARKSAILYTALDCIITIDHQGNVVEFNPAAEETFGYRREQVLGKQLADFIIPHALRERQRLAMAHYLTTGEGPILGKRLELPALRADGTVFPVEIAITGITTDGPPLFTAYLRDVSEHKRTEQHRTVRIAVTHALSEAAGPTDGAADLLRAVCDNLGWDVGFFWTVNEKETALRCVQGWKRSGVTVAEFETDSFARTFKKGEGLPGCVWATRKPRWLLDVVQEPQFPRAASAARYGLHSAFACPVTVGDRTLGIIEFFTRRIHEPDAGLLEMMGTVAGNFGQFLERKAAEEQVRHSERELTDFFENATVGLHWVGANGTILRANRAQLELLGYSPEEYVGRPIADFHADEATICDILNRLQAGEELHEYPARLKCKDGSIKDVLIHSSVLFRDGVFVHTRCFTRDVTEAKRAEDLLHESEERFRGIFSQTVAGVAQTDMTGRFVLVNQRYSEIVGRPADELTGLRMQDITDPDDLSRNLSLFQAMVDGGPPFDIEKRYVRPDDSHVWVSNSVSLIRDSDGHPKYVVAVVLDITERKRVEKELRESEQRFARFMQYLPGLAWIKDVQGRYVYANDSAVTAFRTARTELYGQTDKEVFPPEIAVQFQRNDEQAISSGTDVQVVETLEQEDGELRYSLVSKFPILGSDGEVALVGGMAMDISEQKRAEEELRYRHELLRTVTDTATTAIFMMDERSRCTFMNPAAEQMTGYSFREAEGQILHDLIHHTRPDGTPYPVSECPIDRALPERFIVHNHEDLFVRKDCSQFPVLCNARPVFREGVVVGTVVEVRDITLQKQAEAALRESEERLRLALDAGRMGVWDWNLRTGELNWSDSLEPLHGLAPGTFGGTFDHFQQLIHPKDRESVNAAIRQALDTRGEFYVEFRNVWQNGGIHWIAGSGKVFFGDDGQPLRMIGIGLDVTLRKRAEQTARFLAGASAALAVLVDFDSTLQKVASLAVPSFADWATVDLVEADGSLRRVSVSHVDTAKVQLAHDVHRRFPPDPAAPQGAWNILRTGRSEMISEITDELLVQSVNDDELLGIMRELGLKSYIGVPLTVRGKTLAVITFVNAESGHRYDLTDLAVAEDLASRAAIAIENAQLYRELRDADQRKDEFLATLAHELRNPLAPIRNGLQVLRLSGSGGPMGDEVRSMMERQLSQMVRLVDDLLDVSRITRNKLDLKKQRVELAAVVQSAIETSRPLMEQSGHEFSLTLPPTPICLDADLPRLAQVFSNLLNNSAKYTEPGGSISLVGEVAGGEVVVCVRDNGIGIPAESLPHIFQLFSQVDRNMERAQGGLGIGLSLVRRLVEMHDGAVEARSDGPGWGSQFVVRLPIVKPTRQALPSQGDDGLLVTAKRRILVVDDNRDSATSLGMMFNLMGSETHTAHDGLAAVEAAETFRPDLILLDIGLPKLNGYDACRRIREQPWSKGIVIVALTGWGQAEDRRRSQEAGFDHHLVKPIDAAELNRLLGERKS